MRDKVVRLDKTTPFQSVLVANRGEIALRIMETVRDKGLRAIAVYTDADAEAPHVKFADRAMRIGEGPVEDSYLSIAKVLEAAKESGAEAIHPGYGFLSENADFVRACTEAGLVYIGPSVDAVELMGNKARAKRTMAKAGVPCVPGYEGEDQSPKTMATEADAIGYPVMIKAAGGGGGRGMRLVERAQDFEESLKAAKTEALSAFGSDEIILERAIQSPRHVEVQIFADRKGNTIHLGERDCSVQRRHQKVIEESPCPVLTETQRNAMCSAAVKAAKAINYEGAGTVEFLLDADGKFYFLEMNTRLQVEHPITEMVTGLDLVSMQIATAMGYPLGMTQSEIEFFGHALEVRLYAEDPANGFLPSTGRIVRLDLFNTPFARVDCGVFEGQEISPHYDPMIAKIITHGESREEAVYNMISALENMHVFGPATNRDFLLQALQQESFLAGNATTAFIDEHFDATALRAKKATPTDFALAAALLVEAGLEEARNRAVLMADELIGWGSPGQLTTHVVLLDGDRRMPVRVRYLESGHQSVSLDDQTYDVELTSDEPKIDGNRIGLHTFEIDGDRIFLGFSSSTIMLTRERATGGRDEMVGGQVLAPMHGNLMEVHVATGDKVEVGSRLAVLEAMKMQHELQAAVAGTVKGVLASAGEQVQAGSLLIEIEEEAS